MSERPESEPGAPTLSDPNPSAPSQPDPKQLTALRGKRILLGVCGSIAAYKAVLVLRLLSDAGATVRCMLTDSASRFIGAETLSGLSGQPVLTDMYSAEGSEPHVELAQWADALAIVPATADTLARLAGGHAAGLLDAVFLCLRRPVVIAPAMHASMYEHPAVQANLEKLKLLSHVTFVGPVVGALASGEVGAGRLSEPADIAHAVADCFTQGDLSGRRLLITAGPTVEDIDPVRYLSNRSSGKMGFSLAQRAQARGALVTLISGPVQLASAPEIERIDVRSARDMQTAIHQVAGPSLDRVDAIVMAAAVGDYRPESPAAHKLKRQASGLSLKLISNSDILAQLGAARQGETPTLIGFAVETSDAASRLAEARRKLQAKACDLIVLNSDSAFDAETNQVTLVSQNHETECPLMSKRAVADAVLDWLSARMTNQADATLNRES